MKRLKSIPIKDRPEFKKKLADKIKLAMAVTESTVTDLAICIGVEPVTLSSWKCERYFPQNAKTYYQVLDDLDVLLEDRKNIQPVRVKPNPVIREDVGGEIKEEIKRRIASQPPTSKNNAHTILMRASNHMSNRAATYDKPDGERSMGKTVDMFNSLTGRDLTEEEGWALMAILKLVRSQQGGYRADNYEDGAAYFALAGEAASDAAEEVV